MSAKLMLTAIFLVQTGAAAMADVAGKAATFHVSPAQLLAIGVVVSVALRGLQSLFGGSSDGDDSGSDGGGD